MSSSRRLHLSLRAFYTRHCRPIYTPRHCEERSDEAILYAIAGIQDCRALRARNDIYNRDIETPLPFGYHLSGIHMEKAQRYGLIFTTAALVLILAVAFYFRVVLPYDTVFHATWIKLTGIDAYFYMRLVDNLVHNFPHLISFDPYYIYPGGGHPGDIRFFAFMMAGIIKLLGGASPSQQAVDAIAVWVPAVMGVLVIIPVYFIARALAGRLAGLVAAVAAAVLPGEFLNRSMLGFTDHHITEVFFTTFFVLFFLLALQHSRQFSYRLLKEGLFPPLSRHIPYSFIAGVYDHTKGVARKINNLCRSALLLGVTENKQILDEMDLKRVIRDQEGQTG